MAFCSMLLTIGLIVINNEKLSWFWISLAGHGNYNTLDDTHEIETLLNSYVFTHMSDGSSNGEQLGFQIYNSILLGINLGNTQNIITALFLIPHVKTSKQTFNRLPLWIVWSVRRVWVIGNTNCRAGYGHGEQSSLLPTGRELFWILSTKRGKQLESNKSLSCWDQVAPWYGQNSIEGLIWWLRALHWNQLF